MRPKTPGDLLRGSARHEHCSRACRSPAALCLRRGADRAREADRACLRAVAGEVPHRARSASSMRFRATRFTPSRPIRRRMCSIRCMPPASAISTPPRLPRSRSCKNRFPDAHCHFMTPVRAPGAAHTAFTKYSVRDYVVDCDYELDKLLAETKRRPERAHLRAHRHAARRRRARALEQIRHDAGRRGALAQARGGSRRDAGADLPCRLAMSFAVLLCAGDRDGAAHGRRQPA